MARRNRQDREANEFDERIISIIRTAKVVKGGRRFGFRVVVVVGDRQGKVGLGVGKAREVPEAIRKGIEKARRSMIEVPLVGNTIPHPLLAEFGAAKVIMKPASPGTGVIAGGGVRAVVEIAGIRDILTKSLGSNNSLNVARATMKGLSELKTIEQEAARRGKDAKDVSPVWWRDERV